VAGLTPDDQWTSCELREACFLFGAHWLTLRRSAPRRCVRLPERLSSAVCLTYHVSVALLFTSSSATGFRVVVSSTQRFVGESSFIPTRVRSEPIETTQASNVGGGSGA
jgi:hypothetical protein